jgi:hypothetical protein
LVGSDDELDNPGDVAAWTVDAGREPVSDRIISREDDNWDRVSCLPSSERSDGATRSRNNVHALLN